MVGKDGGNARREGRKEDDDRAVGTASRHIQNDEAERRTGHVDEDKPRLLGEYSRRAVDAADEDREAEDESAP